LSEVSLEILESLMPVLATSAVDPAGTAQEHEEAARAIATLQELPHRDRLILWAVLVEGQSHRECSRMLGLTKTCVVRTLARAMTHMLRRLRVSLTS
jgi:DNA-directed RNA polymerase specialized sigma24 family protein